MAKFKFKPPKVKAPKGKKGGKGGEDEEEESGYEEWLGQNTGGYANATLPPIPIEWNISPTNLTTAACPSVGSTAGLLVSADLISGILSLLFCWCIVSLANFDRKSRGWSARRIWFTWLIGFTLEALGNLINAAIVVTSKGYRGLALGHVFLVYSSRPRIKIWVFAVARWLRRGKEHYMMESYFSLAVVEVMLHIMAAAFIGVTWSRFPNEAAKEHMSAVTTYMQVVPGILALAVLLIAPIWRRSGDPRWLPTYTWDFILLLLFFGTVYAAPWAYWAIFLRVAGPLWCPPQLPGQGAVWVVFSTLSSALSF